MDCCGSPNYGKASEVYSKLKTCGYKELIEYNKQTDELLMKLRRDFKNFMSVPKLVTRKICGVPCSFLNPVVIHVPVEFYLKQNMTNGREGISMIVGNNSYYICIDPTDETKYDKGIVDIVNTIMRYIDETEIKIEGF